MDRSRESECSDTYCVIFLVDSTCYSLFNLVFGVTIGYRLIPIEFFENQGVDHSGSTRYMVEVEIIVFMVFFMSFPMEKFRVFLEKLVFIFNPG